MAAMESISCLISAGDLSSNFSVLYMLQNAQRFQGQLRVIRTSSEKLPPSLGGRYTPVSKLYLVVAWCDIATPCFFVKHLLLFADNLSIR
jgi:hypothetical protein